MSPEFAGSRQRPTGLEPALTTLGCRLGEELGRGAYGQVYRGMDTRTGQHVAIKQLSLERIPAESLQVRRWQGKWGGCQEAARRRLQEMAQAVGALHWWRSHVPGATRELMHQPQRSRGAGGRCAGNV